MDFRRVFLTYLEAPNSILAKNPKIGRILLNLPISPLSPCLGSLGLLSFAMYIHSLALAQLGPGPESLLARPETLPISTGPSTGPGRTCPRDRPECDFPTCAVACVCSCSLENPQSKACGKNLGKTWVKSRFCAICKEKHWKNIGKNDGFSS